MIGAQGVLIADLTGATSDVALKEFNLRNAKLTYLDTGDRYNFKTRTTTPSAEKLNGKRLDPNEAGYAPYYEADEFYPDVLGNAVILNLMTNLIDNKQKEVIGLVFSPPGTKDAKPDLGFEFQFRKGSDSLGYLTSGRGGEDYTVCNIYLDIRPVKMSSPLYTATQPGRSGAN